MIQKNSPTKALIYTVIVVLVGTLWLSVLSHASVSYKEKTKKELRLKRQIQFHMLIKEIVKRESGGKHFECWGDNNTSYGQFQFQEETFNRYAKKYGMKNAYWKNKDDQRKLATRMIKDGYGHEWSVYKTAYKKVYGEHPERGRPIEI